ncbi:MAG: tRNA pseudouridine(13) synthase TruD [archaeon]
MLKIKKNPKDFKVEEITPEKEVLKTDKEYEFEESEGSQLICVLIKRDWEQNRAIKEISNKLHFSRKRIGYAGTKDKRALTSQRISIYRADSNDIEKLRIKDMDIKPVKRSEERITLGDLWGNKFTVKIKTDKDIKLKERIPNYYGHQRFGKTRPITHLVGEAIIKEKPEEAVKIYLTKNFEDESEDAKKARKWLERNWDKDRGKDEKRREVFKEALKKYPNYLGYERTLLHHLVEYPRDYINSLRKLPKSLEIMFAHAYQSYLFNEYLDLVKSKIEKREIEQEKGPVYGYETDLKNEYEEKVLKDNGLELKDFKVNCLPELSEEGERRELYVEINDLEVIEDGKNYYEISFSLPKGSYATVAIESLFEEEID